MEKRCVEIYCIPSQALKGEYELILNQLQEKFGFLSLKIALPKLEKNDLTLRTFVKLLRGK